MHVELKEGQKDLKIVPPQMTSGKKTLFLLFYRIKSRVFFSLWKYYAH